MAGSQLDLEEGARAAARIAADPAFAALDASGAPILAARGDPLAIVYLNEAARAVFGEDAATLADRLFRGADPGAKRLAELVESVRHGAALRLERLSFPILERPQTVTFLCRGLAGDDGDACFVLAALGVRPQSRAPAPAVAAPEAEESPSDATLALRARLAARHGARPPRFLWKTDAQGRFVDVTYTLADVVGEWGADILGRSVEEVAQTLSLGPALGLAAASRRSWSGLEVGWPLEGGAGRVPATLGALPMLDATRHFKGFQGYGVLHLDRAIARESAGPTEARKPSPAPEETREKRVADNIVVLRPQPPAARVEPEGETVLSSVELSAFDEIARTLREGGPADAEAEPAGDEAAPAAPIYSSQALLAALDHLPVGMLVARGQETLYANRALLDDLGYADRAAFDADGGFAHMFFGRTPGQLGAEDGPGAASVQASDGGALDLDAQLQIVEWDGGPATLVVLRRHRPRRARGPEQSALALARALEEKLARARAENAALDAAFDCVRAPLAIVAGDGRFERFNPAFAAFFSVEPRMIHGRNLASLFTAADAPTLVQRLALARADANEQFSLTALGGGGLPVEVTLRRLAVDGAARICVSLRERAARGRGDRELEAARLAAEAANAAKSDFLARVSHEIRTPLNAIIGFAEVMMEERLGPIGAPRYKEYLKDVHASGQHVLSLVNDLLDLSKIEAGKLELSFERVDANAVIAECASIMQAQANQARIVMRLALESSLPPIRADARSLKQILLNLLSNAVKFNEPGGQVIVSSALTDAGYVVIRVKDTGIGMSEDEIEMALEPFKQIATSRKAHGTGLGLPLTKALIEANHASFTIQSRKNEGTLIEIAFPPPQVLAAE